MTQSDHVKMTWKQTLAVGGLLLGLIVACLYLTARNKEARLLADAQGADLNPFRKGAYKKGSDVMTTIFTVPCPAGYDCEKLLPDKFHETLSGLEAKGMPYTVEFDRCDGKPCQDLLYRFLREEGGVFFVKRYLKDKHVTNQGPPN